MQNMKQHVKTLLATLCLLILCGAQRTEAQQHLTFQGIYDSAVEYVVKYEGILSFLQAM